MVCVVTRAEEAAWREDSAPGGEKYDSGASLMRTCSVVGCESDCGCSRGRMNGDEVVFAVIECEVDSRCKENGQALADGNGVSRVTPATTLQRP